MGNGVFVWWLLYPIVGTTHQPPMTYTLEIRDELRDRLDEHCQEGESYEEFIAELVSMYETEGTFLQEGYSE
jgi:hypothetical protein